MAEHNLPNDFYLSLTEFLLHAKQQVVSISASFGLSSMQALTLLVLDDQLRPMNAFQKLYSCDASNITGIIDGLEDKKLVSRQPHPKDRRIKVIRLEASGKKLRQKIVDKLSANSHELFIGLNENEVKQLAGLIQKVSAAL